MTSENNAYQGKLNLATIIWAGFALLAINALLFINTSAAPHIKADVWRHLDKIIIPLMEGGHGLATLWNNHHPSPLLHIIQLINIKFAEFRLDLHGYLGFLFQTLTAFLLLKSILTTTYKKTSDIGGMGLLAGLLITSLLLGFNNTVQYTWPLVSTVQYIYFFGLLVFLSVDKCIRFGSPTNHLLVATASLILMFANADYGLIFLASIIATTILAYIIDRQHVYLSTALVISTVLLGYRLLLVTLTPDKSYSAIDSTTRLYALLDQPFTTLVTYSLGLSTGFVDMVALKNKFPAAEHILVGIALFITALFAVVFMAYLKKRLWKVTTIPLALMLVSIIFSAGVFANRYDPLTGTIWSLAWPRYSPTQKLAAVGMLWALWLLLMDREACHGKKYKPLPKAFIGLVMSLILLLQAAQIYSSWKIAPYHQLHNDNACLGIFLAGNIQENNIELPSVVIGSNKNYHNALAFLKRNRLNVFSDNFPKGALLKDYSLNRQLFHSSDNIIATSTPENKQNRVVSSTGSILTTWKILPNGISITNGTTSTMYIRILASANTYTRNGILLRVKPGSNQPDRINIYKGRQHLYFDLQAGEQLQINTKQDVRIDEFELREE